ncbi:MAG: ribosome small subunit-dependent GTPase A [Gemmataceae bacterium]
MQGHEHPYLRWRGAAGPCTSSRRVTWSCRRTPPTRRAATCWRVRAGTATAPCVVAGKAVLDFDAGRRAAAEAARRGTMTPEVAADGEEEKVRVDLREEPQHAAARRDWKKLGDADAETRIVGQERVQARGDLSRRRTIIQDSDGGAPAEGVEMPAADPADSRPGRVLRVYRDVCVVQADDDGREVRCVVRWLLRSLTTSERGIVTTGDRVWFKPAEQVSGDIEGAPEGVIVRVEPRKGVLTRASRKREHVLVANVDQVVFVLSLVEPALKPHLIDRFLASALKGEIQALLCLNKADLVEPLDFVPLVGFYSQLGVPTLLTSARSGLGLDELRDRLRGRQTVFSGQSGVGKSSLLNAIEPELGLRVREVSDVTQKGQHTTTTAELIRLSFGGWVVDTPGVRQFQLFDTLPEEVEGYFVEFRPFVALCGFPDCTHTHEERCAVKRAVYRRQISYDRYTSYVGMSQGIDD